MSRAWKFRLTALAGLFSVVIGFVCVNQWSVSGQSRSKAPIQTVNGVPVFDATPVSEKEQAAASAAQYTVTELQDSGTVDMRRLGIKATKQPMPHVTDLVKASTVGKGAFFGASHEIAQASTTSAFGTLATDFTPGENVDFYLNGALASTFAANATNGYVAVGINTAAGAGFITIDEIGQTSGKATGGVVQVSTTGPFVRGVTVGPHAFNNTAAAPFVLMYGWTYPNSTTVNLYRNATVIGTAATNTSGRYFVSVAAAGIPSSPDSAAVYGGDITGVAGSYAGASVEERSDAGGPPSGDANYPKAFVDRAFFNSAAAATFALVGENFLAGEGVTLSGCAAAPVGPADANGSVGVFLTAPAGAATYVCVLTGSISGRIARAAVVGNANGNTYRGLIIQPSLANPNGTAKALATKLPASDTGQVFVDGVGQGAAGSAVVNASGYGSFTFTKPAASGFVHAIGWISGGGDQAAVLNIVPNVTTAAGVRVSGRVMTSDGRGLTNAYVSITGPNGASRSVITGRNGAFSFDDVASGATYTISVNSRRFGFSPRVIEVTDDLTGVDFTPDGTRGDPRSSKDRK